MGTIINDILNMLSPSAKKASLSELKVSAATDMGKERTENEDNFYADGIGCRPDNDGAWTAKVRQPAAIFAVCDGMGGENCGKEASGIAAELLSSSWKDFVKTRSRDTDGFVKEYVKNANREICDMSFRESCGTSGSTLALVYIADDIVHAYHIGDSRIYFYHEGRLEQITEDHTLAISKLKANVYTDEEARNSPDAHKLTIFLGSDKRDAGLKPAVNPEFELSDGMILICSDGLTDMCTDEEIAEVLSLRPDAPAEKLVEQALQNGGEDNVTCIVIQKN